MTDYNQNQQHSAQDFSGSQIFGSSFNNNYPQNTSTSASDTDDQKKPSNDAGLLSCSIQQIKDAPLPDTDQPFIINGKSVSQLLLIGRVQHIQHQSTHTEYLVTDDRTSDEIKVKYWLSDNETRMNNAQNINTGDLIKIYGRIDIFNGSKSVNAHRIMNELKNDEQNYHNLEVEFAAKMNALLANSHIPAVKQALEKYASMKAQKYNQGKAQFSRHVETVQRSQRNVNNNNMQYQSPSVNRNAYQNSNNYGRQQQQSPMFNRSPYQQRNTFNNNNNSNVIPMVENSVPPMVEAIFKVLESAEFCEKANGVHINDIAKHHSMVKYSLKKIESTCAELVENGQLYTTLDDNIFKKTT